MTFKPPKEFRSTGDNAVTRLLEDFEEIKMRNEQRLGRTGARIQGAVAETNEPSQEWSDALAKADSALTDIHNLLPNEHTLFRSLRLYKAKRKMRTALREDMSTGGYLVRQEVGNTVIDYQEDTEDYSKAEQHIHGTRVSSRQLRRSVLYKGESTCKRSCLNTFERKLKHISGKDPKGKKED
ncbi:hypothetical protein BCR39DRAFT_578576 [Naematelia encephala]|uniref:Uncharacterized protein n=1 Tax=Naematelia encephala TaxID=71784 RepID=A0A1Y2AVS8_9TREE|nr:hypothetical protein BCR39DRAFT_578576 [Naematelia encephala]